MLEWRTVTLACVLMAVGARSHSEDADASPSYTDLTTPEPPYTLLEDLRAELAELQSFKDTLYTTLGAVQTKLSMAQERINTIKFRKNANLDKRNDQQDKTIQQLNDQVKTAQHTADLANQQVTSAQELADVTVANIPDLVGSVDLVVTDTDNLAADISELDNSLDDVSTTLEDNIGLTIESLDTALLGPQTASQDLLDFLDHRTCEYGTVTSDIPGSTTVTLNSDFMVTPSVVTSVVGFRAHLLPSAYHSPSSPSSYGDVLGFNVTVVDPSTTGFVVTVQDLAEDGVLSKAVSVRYMACQLLDQSFE